MNILTDAEYRQLTAAEQSAYWRARCLEAEEQRDHLLQERVKYRYALIAIEENAHRALDTA